MSKPTIKEPADHLVWFTGGYNGDCVIWWGPDHHGYTTEIDKAGRYTKTEAFRLENLRGQEKAVPVAVALAAMRKHVVAERLREELEKAGLLETS